MLGTSHPTTGTPVARGMDKPGAHALRVVCQRRGMVEVECLPVQHHITAQRARRADGHLEQRLPGLPVFLAVATGGGRGGMPASRPDLRTADRTVPVEFA